ncbi:uncharacterized protein LOC122814478 [Protopterus annectens]|uniref:uncharacterized protein LOC122814478 n=1 Tax=Protopterus annectens TaxID=7888 RepID=UPI001CFAB57E|nr:uncharacterized protein LOC122814478 [Protopterus annectens]
MATIRVLQGGEINNKYLEVEVAQGLDFTEMEWLLRATYKHIQSRLFYLLREHYTHSKFLKKTVIMFSPPHYRVTSLFAKSFHGWTDTAHRSDNLEDLRRALPVCSGAKAGQRIQRLHSGWNYPLFDRMHRGVSCEDTRNCPECRKIYQSLQQCKDWSWNLPDVLPERLHEYNMLVGLSPLSFLPLFSHGYFTSQQEWLRTAEVPSGRKEKDLLNHQRCHTREEQFKVAVVLSCGHRSGTDFLNLYWDVARKESPPCPCCFNKDFDSALYCKDTASDSAWTPHTRRSIEWIVNLEGKASDKYEASVMNSVYKGMSSEV